MSSVHALCCLSLKKQKHVFHFFVHIETIGFGFCDIQNNQGRVTFKHTHFRPVVATIIKGKTGKSGVQQNKKKLRSNC